MNAYRLGEAYVVENYTGSGIVPGWHRQHQVGHTATLVPLWGWGYTMLPAGTAVFVRSAR